MEVHDNLLLDAAGESLVIPDPVFDDGPPFGDDREEGFADDSVLYSISIDAPLLCRRSAEDSSVNQTIVRFFTVLDGRRAAVVTEDRFGDELCDCTARHEIPNQHTIDEEVLDAPCRYLDAFRRWGFEALVDTGAIVAHGEKVWSIVDEFTDSVYVVEQTRLQTLRCNTCSGRCNHGKQVARQGLATKAGTAAPSRQAKQLISQFDPDIGDHGDWMSSQGKRYLSTYCPRLFVGVLSESKTLSEGSHDLIQLAFAEDLAAFMPLALHHHYFREKRLGAQLESSLIEQQLEQQRREQSQEEPGRDEQSQEEMDRDEQSQEEMDRDEQDQDEQLREQEQGRDEQSQEQDRDRQGQEEDNRDEHGQEGQGDEQREGHNEQDQATEDPAPPHWSHPTDTCIVYLFGHMGAAFVSVPYCTPCGCVAHDVDRLFDIYVGPLVSKEPCVAYGIPMQVVRYLTFHRMSGKTLKSVYEQCTRVVESPSMVVASWWIDNPPTDGYNHKPILGYVMERESISIRFPSEATFRRLYNVTLTR
jgi:hypothetical protein